jgi:hypothetical protein
MSGSTSSVLLQHLIPRVQQDVQVLVDLGHIATTDAGTFLMLLPNTEKTLPKISLTLSNHDNFTGTPTTKRRPPPMYSALKVTKVQARALWA